MRAVVGQAQAARTQAAPGGQEHFASLVQGLYSRILRLSRNCNLQMPPAAAGGGMGGGSGHSPGPGGGQTFVHGPEPDGLLLWPEPDCC
jgi:hypothetical protein